MAENAFPFDAGAGSSVREAQWSKMARLWRDDGVIPGLTNELEVTANASGMHVFVDTGTAWQLGFYYENTASLTVDVDAASVQDRIDRIVVRLDTTANTMVVHVIKGTPAATPSEPPLLAGPVIWDLPLARVFVDSAAVTIGAPDLTDERQWSTIDADTLDGHDSTYFATAKGYKSNTYVINTYSTGGEVIPYGVTFTVAPFPVVTPGDTSFGPFFPVPIDAARTTTTFKVKCYDAAGIEVLAGTLLRINWFAHGEHS